VQRFKEFSAYNISYCDKDEKTDCLQNCFSYILLVGLALRFADVLQPLCHGLEQVLQALALVFLQNPDGVFETAGVSAWRGWCLFPCVTLHLLRD
jgi:hypothetical protein